VNRAIDYDLAAQIAGEFRIPRAGARFLVSRGFTEDESIRHYLYPSPDDAVDPFAFDNMRAAVATVEKAVKEGRPILIHGDYDVDGISGTAILYQYLWGLTDDVHWFLPDRRKDGYGLAERMVDRAIEKPVGLFIAVDCGTSDIDQIDRLESHGIDVIVCDHHELPAEGAIGGVMLNPVRPGESYPNRLLCGAGVAFKLAEALHRSGIKGARTPESQTDLLALATVGDIMPLVAENRYYVWTGLRRMNASPRPGLEAIKSYSRIGSKRITSGHISFVFAPRLNAPGRMTRPGPSLEILCTEDMDEARRLASVLEYENERRRNLTDIVREDAFLRIREMSDRDNRGGFVLAAEHWDEGVLGIAAARVAEEFGKPAILLAVKGAQAKGSGRSVRGVDLKKHVDRLRDYFVKYGGHSQAVGLTIRTENIDRFDRELSDSLKEDVDLEARARPLDIAASVELEECSLDLIDFLSRCEPFGLGNKEPVWEISDVQVMRDTTYVGNGHLRLVFQDTRRNTMGQAIAFGWDREESPDDLHGRVVDIAVKLRRGFYMEREYPELRLVDIRHHLA
jgi:single-stranded-DNA-specific exonuclease